MSGPWGHHQVLQPLLPPWGFSWRDTGRWYWVRLLGKQLAWDKELQESLLGASPSSLGAKFSSSPSLGPCLTCAAGMPCLAMHSADPDFVFMTWLPGLVPRSCPIIVGISGNDGTLGWPQLTPADPLSSPCTSTVALTPWRWRHCPSLSCGCPQLPAAWLCCSLMFGNIYSIIS